MHSLHAILVHIPTATESAEKEISAMTKDEIKDYVIRYAENKTDYYYDWVFDGRSLWEEDEGSQPVIFASDNWEYFKDVLLAIDRDQKGYAKHLLKMIDEEVGSTDVSDILSHLLLTNDRTARRGDVDPDTWRWDYLNQAAWALKQLACLIHGDYTFDSEFYDTNRGTALVPYIDELKEKPEEWAIVQFDYHF